jgi:hypothetical protein
VGITINLRRRFRVVVAVVVVQVVTSTGMVGMVEPLKSLGILDLQRTFPSPRVLFVMVPAPRHK